jgi:two-component system, NarL family, invasion response regulator UvrY
MKKILLVDDHAIVQYGIMQLLLLEFPETKIHTAQNMDEMVSQLRLEKFDLLVMDINIPGGNNLQMVDIVKLRQPDIRILVFSGYDEHLYALRYLQSGVHGYLNKNNSEKELPNAIKAVLNGEKYVSHAVRESLLNKATAHDNSQDTGNPLKKLSNRELDVLQSLVNGMTLSEISSSLNLGISTVSTYKQRIFEKLEIHNIIELVEKVKLFHNYPRLSA